MRTISKHKSLQQPTRTIKVTIIALHGCCSRSEWIRVAPSRSLRASAKLALQLVATKASALCIASRIRRASRIPGFPCNCVCVIPTDSCNWNTIIPAELAETLLQVDYSCCTNDTSISSQQFDNADWTLSRIVQFVSMILQ